MFSIFDNWTFLDFCIVIVHLAFTIKGAQQGGVNAILGLVGWVIALYLAITYNSSLAIVILPELDEFIASAIAFVLIIISVVLVERIIAAILKMFKSESKLFNITNAIVGLIVGGFLGWSLISWGISYFNELSFIEEAKLYRYYNFDNSILSIIDQNRDSYNNQLDELIPSTGTDLVN